MRPLLYGTSIDDIVILNGCDITVNGQDYEITSGIAYHQDEIFIVDASSFTAPVGQIGVWAIDSNTIQGTFGDGLSYDLIHYRKLKFISGAAGSGLKDWNEAVKFGQTQLIDLVLLNGALQHPGAVYPAGHPAPGYYKDAMGHVHLYGWVQRGSNDLIATLPEGFRPKVIWGSTGSSFETGATAAIHIDTNGDILVQDAESTNLFNIIFPTI